MRPAPTPVRANPPAAADPAFVIGMTKLVRLIARQAAADHHARCAPTRQTADDAGTPAD
jgi:hypothetical protein